MGCLNSTGNFKHWFGNIHLSGPCNRSCYFCIGQHMMSLDAFNVLERWPLPGLDEFIAQCTMHNVKEVNLTGTNTDPLLYAHIFKLRKYLREAIPGVRFGVRTNGALWVQKMAYALFDKAAISVTSFNPEIYRKTMGSGEPPDLKRITDSMIGQDPVKLNIVLCPENTQYDLLRSFGVAERAGITRVNLREPYGQPHIGDPMPALGFIASSERLGMPQYKVGPMTVTYWDVHYVEVESVNLYATGRVSVDYPITRGHSVMGEVKSQAEFPKAGRVREQWVRLGNEWDA